MSRIVVPFKDHDHIDKIARNFLQKHHPKDTYPIPIEKIIEFQLKLDIIPIPGLHKVFDIDGFLSSDRTGISVDDGIYHSRIGRYRFTLAHEIGHFILHKGLYEQHIFKTINEVFMNFRAMVGSISVNIYTEDRDGVTSIAKAFTITSSGASGTSGIGTDVVGTMQLGLTAGTPTVSTGELPKRALLYKSSRIVQIEIKTTGKTSDYELLNCKLIGIPQSRGNTPSSWAVS